MIEMRDEQIEITADQISKWHPMIAVPCYDQSITEPFFLSTLKMAVGFTSIGLNFGLSTASDSLINRGRNTLVAKFLANPEFTHLMFIDADIGYDYEDIIKLLWHDKDIITGSYPIKSLNWASISELSKNGVSPDELMSRTLRYVVNPVNGKSGDVEVENGAMKIYEAGTGFMLIKRSVFESLIENFPELKYDDDTGSLNEEEKKWTYAFFNSFIDKETNRFLSEDYGFCHLYSSIGGSVWVDGTIHMVHLGRMKYEGKMYDFLERFIVGSDSD